MGVENDLHKSLGRLTNQELRELVMINAYKVQMARNHIDAITEILIKKKITTYEQLWKMTRTRFQEQEEVKKSGTRSH